MIQPQAMVVKLIRAELCASEIYRRALETVGEEPGSGELRRIEWEHRLAADDLSGLYPELARPGSYGLWESWICVFETAALAFGNTAAVFALKEEEIHGIKDYARTLSCVELPAGFRLLIESRLLPRARAHVPALEDFLRLQRRLPS